MILSWVVLRSTTRIHPLGFEAGNSFLHPFRQNDERFDCLSVADKSSHRTPAHCFFPKVDHLWFGHQNLLPKRLEALHLGPV